MTQTIGSEELPSIHVQTNSSQAVAATLAATSTVPQMFKIWESSPMEHFVEVLPQDLLFMVAQNPETGDCCFASDFVLAVQAISRYVDFSSDKITFVDNPPATKFSKSNICGFGKYDEVIQKIMRGNARSMVDDIFFKKLIVSEPIPLNNGVFVSVDGVLTTAELLQQIGFNDIPEAFALAKAA